MGSCPIDDIALAREFVGTYIPSLGKMKFGELKRMLKVRVFKEAHLTHRLIVSRFCAFVAFPSPHFLICAAVPLTSLPLPIPSYSEHRGQRWKSTACCGA